MKGSQLQAVSGTPPKTCKLERAWLYLQFLENLSDHLCWCLPHSMLTFFTGTQLAFSSFSFWLWLPDWIGPSYSHTILCLRSQKKKNLSVSHRSIVLMLNAPGFFFCLSSSPFSLKVPSLDLISPQSSSPRFDLETHYYELNRSVLKVPSLSRHILNSFWCGVYCEKQE